MRNIKMNYSRDCFMGLLRRNSFILRNDIMNIDICLE